MKAGRSTDRAPLPHPILDRSVRTRQSADRWGFVCLDNEWQGREATYRFQCRDGHVFIKTFNALAQAPKGECPVCVRTRRANQWETLLRQSGLTCLESEWLGHSALHRFRCTGGHAWERSGGRALQNIHCPHCGRADGYIRKRLVDGLERLQQAAANRGGQCLSDHFAGVNHTYTFRCAKGHTWQANGGDVLRRTWCDLCARERKSQDYRLKDGLARLQAKASERGGQCLSAVYHDARTRYRFRCGAGHEWETTGARVLRGVWCVACAYDSKRLTINDARQTAAERGGQCLSEAYQNTLTKLHWLCHRGHSWHAPLGNIRAGHWCPECAHIARITYRESKARTRYQVAGSPQAERRATERPRRLRDQPNAAEPVKP